MYLAVGVMLEPYKENIAVLSKFHLLDCSDYCTLCRDCSYIFVSFQTFFLFQIELNISFVFVPSFSHKYIFYHFF